MLWDFSKQAQLSAGLGHGKPVWSWALAILYFLMLTKYASIVVKK